MDRRDFLKVTGGTLFAGAACTYAFRFLTDSWSAWASRDYPSSGKKYGMVIDLTKCLEGCDECIKACREENNVAEFHDDDSRWTIHWLRKVRIRSREDEHAAEKEVLLLCNHCDKPPCGQVCPVQATYKRDDGIVIVDHHRCIGCRYCMIACPYNARYFNFREGENWPNKRQPRRTHGVAESCTLCAHLLDVGEEPACVEACRKVKPEGEEVLFVGDMNDPESDVSKLMAKQAVKRLKEDLGTEPKVHYIGL